MHARLTQLLFVSALLAGHATAQTGATQCGTQDLVPPVTLLSWPNLPTEDSALTLPTGQVLLLVENAAASTREHVLLARGNIAGERVDFPIFSGDLAAGSSISVGLDLDGFGVDISDLDFSAGVWIESRASEGGVLVERAFSPVLYFHQEQDPTGATLTWIYRDGARQLYFRSGDLKYLVYPTGVPSFVVGVFEGGTGSGSLGEGGDPPDHDSPLGEIGVPPMTDGGDMWEFCMRWVYQSIDSGFGEDHYTSGHLMKARGVKLVIDHPDWANARTLYASDVNGCFKFVASQNKGYIVTMFAESRLGEDENLAVRAFDTVSQAIANDPGEVTQWTFMANPGGTPRRVYYENQPGPESDLMAFGSFMVHWIDHQTSPRLAGAHTMRMASDGTGCEGSCQSGNTVRIQPGAEQRKFLVAHEVGHWLHRTWTDDQLGLFEYGANSGDPDCAFIGVGNHAMRSKEYAGGALIEGFAQYLAALAWNDHDEQDGWFKYYKEVNSIAYEDMQAGNWRVDVEGDGPDPVGGISNWMANKCTVHDGHSVEMDWMRFYWDYRTDGVKWTRPGHHELFEHLLYTQDTNPWLDVKDAYDRLLETIDDPGLGQTLFAARFSQKAIQNGVAQ